MTRPAIETCHAISRYAAARGLRHVGAGRSGWIQVWPEGATPGECQQQPSRRHASSVELCQGLPSGEQSRCAVACAHVAVPLGQPPDTSHAALANRPISAAPTGT